MNEIEQTSSTWLDKKFIEDVLRNQTNNPALVVEKIELSAAVDKGVNYASELQRVTAYCHDSATSFTRHFVVKSLPTSETVRELVLECGTFERESGMYERTLPAFREFLGDFGDFSAKVYPSCRPNTIVMEDLKAAGFKLVERRSEGLDYDHCRLVVLALARWHAASVIYIKRRPSVLQEYKEKFYTLDFLPATTAIFQPMFTTLAEEVSTWPDYERYSAKIRHHLTLHNIIELVKPQPGETMVLNHGDPWLNNALFHYTNTTVDAVKLVDFQEIRLGSPALDLQYFFCTSPSVHVRETSWDKLLDLYHSEYCRVLKDNGEEGLILDDMKTVVSLNKKLSEKSLFGLQAASSCLPLIFLDGDSALDVDKLVQGDGDGDESEVGKMFLAPAYIEAFKKLLILFDKEIFTHA